ncbi:MAG: hypothetical protein ACR2IE_10620 [Candidatus Sumerlaeaceae bacterium]
MSLRSDGRAVVLRAIMGFTHGQLAAFDSGCEVTMAKRLSDIVPLAIKFYTFCQFVKVVHDELLSVKRAVGAKCMRWQAELGTRYWSCAVGPG